MGGVGRSGWVVRPHSRLYSIRLGIEIENVHLFISAENLGEKRKHGEGLIEEGRRGTGGGGKMEEKTTVEESGEKWRRDGEGRMAKKTGKKTRMEECRGDEETQVKERREDRQIDEE